MTTNRGARWVRFLRQYGPIPRNENMYDEQIRRYARRVGIRPLKFTHPVEGEVLPLFEATASHSCSVVLTGTAGDGKSYLCRQIWHQVGGNEEEWGGDEPYFRRPIVNSGRPVTLHLIRDLTGMPQPDPKGRYRDKNELLLTFCRALTTPDKLDDVFVIAANDGQLIEHLQRLPDSPPVQIVRKLVETLLVEDRRESASVPLKLFNLSRIPCVGLFDLALESLLSHEGWQDCLREAGNEAEFFGPRCPIRHNYELLQEPLVKARLRALFALCDHNDLHIPIRRILLLLTNAILGHPEGKDRLLRAEDVPSVIQRGTVAKASLFNNVFGGNLSETRRNSLEVFTYLNRFRIGYEATNRIDNILIFGSEDENFRPYFKAMLQDDTFYGADRSYHAAQRAYIEAAEGDEVAARAFLDLLVSQRRGLFFKIPDAQEQELGLWELTVFKFAGEYLKRVVDVLHAGGRVERPILSRLVRGLNRVFVGMLVNTDRELLLATSLSYSTAKVSQILEDRIPVAPRLQERVELILERNRPALAVQFNEGNRSVLSLNLTRYEFLSRVAEGVLPGSFSRECYEDMLAFKTQLLTCLDKRRMLDGSKPGATLSFRLMSLDESGNPKDDVVEVPNG